MAAKLVDAVKNTAVLRGGDGSYLTFILGRNELGLEMTQMKEALHEMGLDEEDISRMPATPLGIINRRDGIIPVMDLRKGDRTSKRGCDGETCIIFINIRSRLVGLAVDAVTEEADSPDA